MSTGVKKSHSFILTFEISKAGIFPKDAAIDSLGKYLVPDFGPSFFFYFCTGLNLVVLHSLKIQFRFKRNVWIPRILRQYTICKQTFVNAAFRLS